MIIKFEHFGLDYKAEIQNLDEIERRCNFHIDTPEHLMPFNPAVLPDKKNIKLAFFGWNAYSDVDHLEDWHRSNDLNFLADIADQYYGKLYGVIGMYREGVNHSYMNAGSVYFSNYIKAVLLEDHFAYAVDTEAALRKSPKTKGLFDRIIASEVDMLKKQGCEYFICFGNHCFNYVSNAYSDIRFIKDRHFSRYWKRTTAERIAEINEDLEKNKRA